MASALIALGGNVGDVRAAFSSAIALVCEKAAARLGYPSDLDENEVRRIGLDAGVVDVKVCAVDDIWSGLKFVRRLRDRT